MRTFIILFIALTAAAAGSVFWKKAIYQTGGLTITSPSAFYDIGKLLANYLFWIGTGAAIIVLLCLFDILSHEDLSYAMPLFSLSYILSLLVAKLFLHEEVTIYRWLSVVLILIGVYIITKTK